MGLREYAAHANQQQQPDSPGTREPALLFTYSAIYDAAIAFHRRHTIPPKTDAEWIEAARDIGATAEALNNSPFALDLLTAIYTEIERVYKATR